MTGPALAVRDLRKSYGSVEAVRGVSLEVGVGTCFGLLGPNGAGKTTTVEILEGLLEATSGSVCVLRRSWKEEGQAIRERLGVCLQQTMLQEKLKVREILALYRSFYKTGRSPEEVMAAVELEEKMEATVRTLSAGQRQRLAVACALVSDPELLFLDEPTTGLDPQSRRQVWGLVNRFKAEGRTVFLTTHYMDEAEKLCDRLAVMDHGRIIAEGTPHELISRLGGDHVIEFSIDLAQGPRFEAGLLEALASVRSVHQEGDRVLLTVGEPHRAIPELLGLLERERAELLSLSTRHASLEDVFVSLTGRHLRDE